MQLRRCIVYWLHDERCICPWRHGYVGVSVQFDARLQRHRLRAGTRKSAVGIPAVFNHKILFAGTPDQCLALEEQLRPHRGIGWHRARGGQKPWLDYRHDAETRAKISAAAKASGHSKGPRSPEFCAKMSAAALRRYTEPVQRAASSSRLRAMRFDRAGPSNGNFGKRHSESTKLKIRELKVKAICNRGHQKSLGKPCRECQRIYNRRAYLKRKHITCEEVSL
jgi:hypothetical protein